MGEGRWRGRGCGRWCGCHVLLAVRLPRATACRGGANAAPAPAPAAADAACRGARAPHAAPSR